MKIVIKKSAQKELRNLNKGSRRQAERIIEAIYKISKNPYLKGAVQLTGFNEFRFRVGSYRILYTIDPNANTISIVAIAHRREAYRF